MPNGYTGRILHVDLTNQKLTVENPPDSFYRQYFGGSEMGMYYLLKLLKPGVDPLGPDNVLTLMVSPLTAAPISGQSRMAANAKSPLTGGIGDSQCGGFFPGEMKLSGFDGLVITGAAKEPVYLWLHDGEAELRPAGHLTGKTTSQAEDIIRAELGDKRVEIAQCGPSGEQLVRLAAIINMSNRANGRTGLGAVMGSKNLRAVAVRGTKRNLPMADAKAVKDLNQWGLDTIPTHGWAGLAHEHGTPGVLAGQNAGGTLPTYNYNAGQFDHWQDISGETLTATLLKERDTCLNCKFECKRVVEGDWRGHKIEPRHGGPEYETLGTFGSYCGVNSLAAISYANQLCNEYGLDTIGAGATISWVMECFENGLLSEEEIGFPVRFGDDAAMIRLLEMMACREGIGDVLSNGSAKAAEILGKGQEYLITVKGAEAPAHMPQAKRSLAVIYAIQPFGADHQSHVHDPSIEHGASEWELHFLRELGFTKTLEPRSLGPEKVDYFYATQRCFSFDDVACLCQFVWGPAWHLYGPNHTVELVQAVTGWQDFTLDEMLEHGERRVTMQRLFNAREGFDRSDDALPVKFFKPLTGTGPTAGVALDKAEVDAAIDMYFDRVGWDKQTGAPTAERLEKLGIGWAID